LSRLTPPRAVAMPRELSERRMPRLIGDAPSLNGNATGLSSSHLAFGVADPINKVYAAGCSLGRTQEAGCCAHLSLGHLRLERTTNFVQLGRNVLELISELLDVRNRIFAVFGR